MTASHCTPRALARDGPLSNRAVTFILQMVDLCHYDRRRSFRYNPDNTDPSTSWHPDADH
jgi:transglutaminase-like putative cysteine protease